MDKRIIEETPSTELLNDDWLIKDNPTDGTTKILGSKLKEIITGDAEDSIDKILDSIAPEWSPTITYGIDSYVIYEGKLWRCFKDTGSTRGEFKTSEWIKAVTSGYITDVVNKIANRFVASNPPFMTYRYSVGDMVFYSEPYHDEQLYVCNTDLPQGESTFNPEHWDVVYTVAGLSKYLMDKIAEAGQIDDVQVKTTGDYESVVDENKVAKIDLSNMLIEKSVPNLPQPIASFSDGAEDLPLKSLKVAIEPLIGGNNNPPSSDNIKPMSGHTSMQIVDMALPANYQPSSDGKIHLAWNDGSTNYDMPFNVCQTETVKDSNNNDVDVCDIESEYVLPFDCVYDEPEAIIASDTDLPAGNYYFKIVNDAWGGNNNKYVSFTLSETLTAGQQIRKKSGGYNASIESCTLGIFTSGADRTGTELAFTISTSQPSSGTDLGQTDGSGNLNHWHCVVLGYNRWKFSAVRQFLNSANAKGSWWTQQHKWDVKPAYADSKDGFLYGFNSNLLADMKETKVVTARNSVFNSGETPLGGFDETYDKVFLISLEQSYINPQISGEGEYWEYYKRLLGRTTPASTGATYARLIKYDLAAQTTARDRWLRSAYRGGASSVWIVGTSGGVDGSYAYRGLRLAPCLRIGLSALNKYTVNFKDESNNPLTVVGGQLNINNGRASVDVYPYYASYNGETLTGEWISDRDVYTEGGTPTTGAQVLNIGGTPTTYTLDDVSISSLNGDNNVFASTGDVTKLEYIANATDVIANLEARVTALENQ